MKLIITESKLKKFIRNRFGLDFTGSIEEVTSAYGLLNDFDGCFSYVYINRRLNKYGPIYLITIEDNFKVLYQDTAELGEWIMDNDCNSYSKEEFMELLGIDKLGLSMEQFIEVYI